MQKESVEVCVSMLELRDGDDLSTVFQAVECSATEYGGGLDIINARVLDMSQVSLQTSTDFFLRSPILSESARKGLVLFVVFRGENGFRKVEDWVLRKCKAPYAGSQGRWKFTRTSEESFHYYSVFFDLRSFAGKSSVKPTYNVCDLRSHERYSLTFESRASILINEKSPKSSPKKGPSSPRIGVSEVIGGSSSSTVSVDPTNLFYNSSDNDEIESMIGARAMQERRLGDIRFGVSLVHCFVVRSLLRRTLGVLLQHKFTVGRVFSFEKDLPTKVKDILYEQEYIRVLILVNLRCILPSNYVIMHSTFPRTVN